MCGKRQGSCTKSQKIKQRYKNGGQGTVGSQQKVLDTRKGRCSQDPTEITLAEISPPQKKGERTVETTS